MMTFRDAINTYPLLKAIYDEMIIKTSMGRDMLYNLEFSTDRLWLEKQYELTQCAEKFLERLSRNERMRFECVLYDMHNISGSVRSLEKNDVLDDIGLFEAKAFALGCRELEGFLSESEKECFHIENLDGLVSVLDPENTRSRQFYVYDAYSPLLKSKREEFETLSKQDDPKANDVYSEIVELENTVREDLCIKLRPYINKVKDNINTVALLDISVAKAEINEQYSLKRPQLSEKYNIIYKGLFNPVIKESLESSGRHFQSIDISVDNTTVLITGANMAGKTVVLKTLALSQLLCQFGFFVPCEECELALVEDIMCSIGDSQDEREGLSSFAAEILKLDSIIKALKQNRNILILVDELARTTNPVEGTKLLNGFIRTVNQYRNLCVITTHYSDITAPCRHLRVKGFRKEMAKSITSLRNIQDLSLYVDYSLIEDKTGTTPNEALNLCRMLDVDRSWLENCEKQ